MTLTVNVAPLEGQPMVRTLARVFRYVSSSFCRA
jgi:hypothetical protein